MGEEWWFEVGERGGMGEGEWGLGVVEKVD